MKQHFQIDNFKDLTFAQSQGLKVNAAFSIKNEDIWNYVYTHSLRTV